MWFELPAKKHLKNTELPTWSLTGKAPEKLRKNPKIRKSPINLSTLHFSGAFPVKLRKNVYQTDLTIPTNESTEPPNKPQRVVEAAGWNFHALNSQLGRSAKQRCSKLEEFCTVCHWCFRGNPNRVQSFRVYTEVTRSSKKLYCIYLKQKCLTVLFGEEWSMFGLLLVDFCSQESAWPIVVSDVCSTM